MPPIVLPNRENRLVFRDPPHLLYVMRDINGGHGGHRRRQHPFFQRCSACVRVRALVRWPDDVTCPVTLVRN